MKYDCVVIGAGVGGLSCALKLSAQGKKVALIEKQPVPGGFATSFRRKGYLFESSIHCVDALAPGGEVRAFLKEHGIGEEVKFIELSAFSRVVYPEHDFIISSDNEQFIKYLQESFSAQSQNIKKLFEEFNCFYREFDHFCNSPLPRWFKFAASPLLYRRIIRATSLTVEKFISAYVGDQSLKGLIGEMWRYLGLPPSRLSAFYFLIVFRGYCCQPTAYIQGGFGRLFEAMVSRIKSNGGEVFFNTAVKGIVTEGSKKVKVVLTDKGERFQTRSVVSNANAPDTLFNLVDDVKVAGYARRHLSGWEKSVSALQVYVGLRVPARQLGMNHFMLSVNTSYDHDQNYQYALYGDYQRCPFTVVDHSQIDPSLVPEGKGSLLIMVLDNYANWGSLNEDAYKEKKVSVATTLISRAEHYLPGLSGCIEVMEVATPCTMERYGSSPEGAIYGFAHSVNQSGINRLSQKTLVKGLFLAGAWTMPGAGVHGCFVSGSDAAALVLHYLGG